MVRLSIPAALLGATLAAALVFGAAPRLDLDMAGLVYEGHGHFVADTSAGSAARQALYWVPTIVLLTMLALYGARRFGGWRSWAPTGRGIVFLVATFAVGPGLMVNTVLKEHSHRPRPVQTDRFGGDEPFRPFHRFDGACRRNCSFVSGEGAATAWTLGAALLVPPPWQGAAVTASLILAACSGALRVAVGGHYLSDVVFAALLSWAVLWVGWIVFRPAQPAT